MGAFGGEGVGVLFFLRISPGPKASGNEGGHTAIVRCLSLIIRTGSIKNQTWVIGHPGPQERGTGVGESAAEIVAARHDGVSGGLASVRIAGVVVGLR